MHKIVASQITEVKAFQLDKRPVFRLQFRDGTALVIKAEFYNGFKVDAVSDNSVLWAGKMMQQATPNLQVEILAQDEVNALKWISPQNFKPFEVRAFLLKFITGNTIYKMPFFDNLRGADDLTEKGKAAKLLSKLKGNSAVLQKLGQIAAIDLFNGNRDRFDIAGNLINKGNLLFVKNADKSYTPVGLDFYEAMGMASNLVADPPTAEGERDKGLTYLNWGGPILMNDRTRMIYACKCIASLNMMFRTELLSVGPIAPNALLGPADEVEFASGMRSGSNNLRKFLAGEAAKGTVPQGILTRMALLHWTWSDVALPARPAAATPNKPGFVSKGVFFESRQ